VDAVLRGVTILDFTQLVQGPFATQVLGDLGAEIIKVEPLEGDWLRGFALDNHYIAGESVSFLGFNRNKRSIAINLKDPRGVAIIHQMIGKVDAVVENFRPGVMDRLGLGYGVLREWNPRIIYCASSGFGSNGPYVTRPGQDILIQAMTGIPTLTGKHGDAPVVPGVSLADLAAGFHIVYGLLAALYHRALTGQGQRVEVDLYSSLLSLLTQEMTYFLNGGRPPERSASGIPNPYTGAPYGLYKTADTYLAVGMNPLNRLASLIGVSGYETITSNNVTEGRDEIYDRLAAAFVHRTTAAWLELLLAEDIWCAPVYTLQDVADDPQVKANGMLMSYQHQTAGTVHTLGLPVRFSATPGAITYPAPLLGQHSAEILKEFGGYSDAEILMLRREQVIV
jgi:crotonobetainyl-CoA:carnitine CoA-transferase CaiB-like acyl-CoA transferase